MRRIFTLVLIFAIGIGMRAQGARWHELNVGNFASLDVINDLNVVCKFSPDSVGVVRFYCEEPLSDAIIFEKGAKSKLKVMISPDFIEDIAMLPTVYVYTDMLESIHSESNKKVSILSPLKCPKFKATLVGNGVLDVAEVHATRLVATLGTGSGTISLSGSGSDTLLKLIGAGSIQAHNLDAKKVTCHLFGGGEIFCNPIDELVAKGIGSTRVYYRTTPKLIKDHSLGGKVKPMDASL